MVCTNDKNNSKAIIILLVFYKDLLSGSKHGDTYVVKKNSSSSSNILIYFLSVINVCRYCIQLLILTITTLLDTLKTEESYTEIQKTKDKSATIFTPNNYV